MVKIPASSNFGQKDANDFRKTLHDTHPKISSTVYDLEYTNTKAGPSNYMLRKEKRDINGCNISGQFRDKQLCEDISGDLTCSIDSWKANPSDISTDTTFSVDSEIENMEILKELEEDTVKGKGKAIKGTIAMFKKSNQTVDASQVNEEKSSDPYITPEFLSFSNEDVSHLFLDKKFEQWNTAFKSWFMENDYVAAKRPNTITIQQYISEICRYSEYVNERMKAKNINWNLNDLLLFNKTNGSSFNTQNGITFFEDPTDYMIFNGIR